MIGDMAADKTGKLGNTATRRDADQIAQATFGLMEDIVG